MALGTAVDVKPIKSFHHGLVRPTQIIVPWVKIIDNSGVDTADNGGSVIDDPDVQITNLTTHILRVGQAGTKLRLRIRYDDAITSFSTPPVRSRSASVGPSSRVCRTSPTRFTEWPAGLPACVLGCPARSWRGSGSRACDKRVTNSLAFVASDCLAARSIYSAAHRNPSAPS